MLRRRWKADDIVAIGVPVDLRLESAPGDFDTVAVLRGPMVMAADLGPSEAKWEQANPAMVGADLLAAFTPAPDRATYAKKGIIRPADLNFVPFYSRYDRHSAVYFKRFSEAAWKPEAAAFLTEQPRLKDIAARSVDVMHPRMW